MPDSKTTETPEERHARHMREKEARDAVRVAQQAQAEHEHTQRLEEVHQEREATRVDIAAWMAQKFGRLNLTPSDPEPLPETPEQKRLRERRERFEDICPVEYRRPWNDELVAPEVNRQELGKVFDWQYGQRGLYIAGETGHAKTRAVWQMVRRMIVKEGRRVLFLDGIAFSNRLSAAFADPASTERVLRELARVELLVIDDLAKRWTPATQEGAFAIVERRTSNGLPIIATLNYTAGDLVQMQAAAGGAAEIRDLAGPLIRRLVDYCEPVVL